MPCRAPSIMPEMTNRIPATPIHVTVSCSTSTAMIGSVRHRMVSTTANIYAHVMEAADKKNADILADVFLKKA